MKYCNFCGNLVQTSNDFCNKCGNKFENAPTQSVLKSKVENSSKIVLPDYTLKMHKLLGGQRSNNLKEMLFVNLIFCGLFLLYISICAICKAFSFSYFLLGLLAISPVFTSLYFSSGFLINKRAKLLYKEPDVIGHKLFAWTNFARLLYISIIFILCGSIVFARYLWINNIVYTIPYNYTQFFSNLLNVFGIDEVFNVVCRYLSTLFGESSFLSVLILTSLVIYIVFIFFFHIKGFCFSRRIAKSLKDGQTENYETITYPLLMLLYSIGYILLALFTLVICIKFAYHFNACIIIGFILVSSSFVLKAYWHFITFKLLLDIRKIEE